MNRWLNRRTLLVLVGLVVAMPVFAQPVPSGDEPAPAEVPDFEDIVREADVLIDEIIEHHIDPPDRLELWFRGALEFAESRAAPGPGFASDADRIRQSTTSEQRAKILEELWSNRGSSESSSSQSELKPAFLEAVLRNQRRPRQVAPQSRPKRAFIDGVLGAVPGGAHLVPRSELTAQEQLQGNRYVGTGIASGYNEELGYPLIAMVIPNGPMARAGGRDGDLILKIDGRDMHRAPMARVVESLRGEEGSKVTVELCAADQFRQPAQVAASAVPASEGSHSGRKTRTVVVARGPVVLETLEGLRKQDEHWDYTIQPSVPIRYVKIVKINGSTVHDLRQLERQFRTEGARAIILDLRSMSAPELHHTLLLADALMDVGFIGRLRTKHQIREFRADRNCLFRDVPLAMLVGDPTNAEGEWIASALQESGQALIIGDYSGENAFVQTTVILPSGDGLRLATGVFEPAGGKPIQARANGRDQVNRATGIQTNEARIGRRNMPGDDAPSNVITVIGQYLFARPGGLDPLVAEAVRQLQMAIHAGRGRAVRQSTAKGPD